MRGSYVSMAVDSWSIPSSCQNYHYPPFLSLDMSQQQFPVAKPRKGSGNYKQQLLEAFQGFQSNAVDEKQIKLANYCIQFGENNYDLIRFQQIVEMNKVRANFWKVLTFNFFL